MQKDHTSKLKILLFMSEFGGLWKYNNPACSESVRSLHSVKLDIIQKKGEHRPQKCLQIACVGVGVCVHACVRVSERARVCVCVKCVCVSVRAWVFV